MLDLRVASTPCLLGYGEIGKRLLSKPEGEVDRSEKNRYYNWAAAYAMEEYQTAVQTGRGKRCFATCGAVWSGPGAADALTAALEDIASSAPLSTKRKQELARIFRQATELEIAFWDSALVP